MSVLRTFIVHKDRNRYDWYIGPGSRWANRFVIGRDGTRDEVIAKYRTWLVQQPLLMRDLSMIQGKILGCVCKTRPCPCQTLADIADGDDFEVLLA